jgi:hypothetical protein
MASPLSLFMPVIPGTDPRVIGAAIAGSQAAIDQALESIGTVHYARFLLLDRSTANLQPGGGNQELVIAVITEYDGSFDAYIQAFSNQLGPVFDALLEFVVGGKALIPVKSNLNAFTAFIAENDASQHEPNTGLYAAYPQTVQQILAAFS